MQSKTILTVSLYTHGSLESLCTNGKKNLPTTSKIWHMKETELWRTAMSIRFSLTLQSGWSEAQQVPALTKNWSKHHISKYKDEDFWNPKSLKQCCIFVASSHIGKITGAYPLRLFLLGTYYYFTIQILLLSSGTVQQRKIKGTGVAPMKYFTISLEKIAGCYSFVQILASWVVFNRVHPLLTGIPILPIPHSLPCLSTCCLSWSLGPGSCKSYFVFCCWWDQA